MIRSMTAFAKQQLQRKSGTISWEIKSVNSRYLDINLRLPELFRQLEPKLREQAAKYLNRGKIDITLRYQIGESADREIVVNRSMVKELKNALAKVERMGFAARFTDPLRILSWPGVMQVIEGDQSATSKNILNLFIKTLKDLDQAKIREGKNLKRFIEQRLSKMHAELAQVRKKVPGILKKQRENLLAKFNELKLEFDPKRLEQEMLFLAQKIDVDEELDRLGAHITETRRVLNQGGAVGRRLDFLMQEMNRESNTLGAKSISEITTKTSVELKVLIEQMREQIQNIE
ncbi:MAG: YicC/YloC family endoribonuclease [Gammaproteobacteria bacterium]